MDSIINKISNLYNGAGHIAAICDHGKIITSSTNSEKRTKFKKSIMCSMHAEVGALYNLKKINPKNINKYTLYVIRKNSKNELCNSLPCSNCMYYIKFNRNKNYCIFNQYWFRKGKIKKYNSIRTKLFSK